MQKLGWVSVTSSASQHTLISLQVIHVPDILTCHLAFSVLHLTNGSQLSENGIAVISSKVSSSGRKLFLLGQIH